MMSSVRLKVLRRSELTEKICIVVGTRPSLVKQSPTIRELQRRSVPFFVIHTGQHYSYEMDAAFFHDLELPTPQYRLDTVKNFTLHGEQTAEMLRGIEKVLIEERPRAVLVGGDANSNLSGALAARKLNINVCHEEAGLRSYDWLMPEEHNRVMIDHISEYLFAPNEHARCILTEEKVRGEIHVTGSSIVDAVHENVVIAQRKSDILERLDLQDQAYLLMTLHHEESVDYYEVFVNIIAGVKELARAAGLPVVFPAHPRTQKRIKEFGLDKDIEAIPQLRLVDAVGYFDFLKLLSNATLVMTDSGGVIQESAILRVLCLTLGRSTEWLETVEVGANRVVGTTSEGIVAGGLTALAGSRSWQDPFGPRGPAGRIVDVLERILNA